MFATEAELALRSQEWLGINVCLLSPPGTRFLVVESSSARAPSGGRVGYNPAGGTTFVWCVELRYVYLHE